jgi:hypothetical protein
MGGVISLVHKRREKFSYGVKTIKYLIRTLSSQIHVLKADKVILQEKTPKTKELNDQYQVFQIIETEVHK